MAILEGQPGEVAFSDGGLGTDRTSFLAKVNARLMGEPADEATEAVFCVLREHLSGGVVQMIHDALPPDVRALLGPCGEHLGEARGGREHARAFDKDEFYLGVAEHLGVPPDDVRRIISAVFHGLHSQLTEAIADRVASQLPYELRTTWANARKAVAAPH